MTAITVWKFATPEGAAHAESLLEGAEQDQLVRILDHAVLSWPQGAEHPKLSHGQDETKRGAGRGAAWGLLVGAMFTVPVVGLAAGAALGALSRKHHSVGISDDDIERIRTEVTEGTSALFVITEEGDLDRLGDRFRGVHSKLVETNLTEAEREQLMETLGGQ